MLARLNKLRKKLLREAAKAPCQPTPPPRRIGEISETVSQALSDADGPLHVAGIHRTVERLLGRPVNYRSVKSCLSEGAKRCPPRFERTAYGCYSLSDSARPIRGD